MFSLKRDGNLGLKNRFTLVKISLSSNFEYHTIKTATLYERERERERERGDLMKLNCSEWIF